MSSFSMLLVMMVPEDSDKISACVCRKPSWTLKTKPSGDFSMAGWFGFWCWTRLFISVTKFSIWRSKGSVFFFFREKFVFSHFWSKIVWVSKKAVFFFPPPEKKKQAFQTSEWVNFNFSRKKKTRKKTDPWKKRKACTNFSKSLEKNF